MVSRRSSEQPSPEVCSPVEYVFRSAMGMALKCYATTDDSRLKSGNFNEIAQHRFVDGETDLFGEPRQERTS